MKELKWDWSKYLVIILILVTILIMLQRSIVKYEASAQHSQFCIDFKQIELNANLKNG